MKKSEKSQEELDKEEQRLYDRMKNRFEERGKRYDLAVERWEARTGFKEGAHVRYIGTDDKQFKGYPPCCSDPRGILDFETIYEIECTTVGRSSASLKLVGFHKERFNPIIFEPVNKDEEKRTLKAGGRVRYIGKTNEVLNYGAIYEVEYIKRSSFEFGYGYAGVKLVDFEEEYDRMLFEKV